jgi:hypothetical protein
VTDLLLQPTGNPSQYEVIADEQIVGRIALFIALRDRSEPWIWTIDLAFTDDRDQTHGFEASCEAAMEASPGAGSGKTKREARSTFMDFCTELEELRLQGRAMSRATTVNPENSFEHPRPVAERDLVLRPSLHRRPVGLH